MKISSSILLLITILFYGCGEKIPDEEVMRIGTVPCQQQPHFIVGLGFNSQRSALSSSEKRMEGLVLVQLGANATDTVGRKTWQHPSWKQFGFMGPITTDDAGNAYTAPVPVINLLDNRPEKQNTIYKVDNNTGEMKPFVELPVTGNVLNENPYGTLGLYFDCHGKKLYTSTVTGSTRDREKGVIYIIDPGNGKIIDQLNGRDAVGLCVGGMSGEKRLYFGSSRTPDVYSIELTRSGKFTGIPRHEFSLDMLGPRGDDKARRIRFDKNGEMLIFGVEFNYNLTAPTEKQETIYRFRYDEEEKKWNFVK